jgi:outer membrane protein OmpA-like peptidoglycan-associated protein
MQRVLAGLSLVLAVSGCASLPERYVVLPEPDGHAGTVIVQRGGGQTVLQGPYSSTASGTDAVSLADPAEVQQTFRDALQATPVRPASFRLFFRTDSDEITAASRAELPAIVRAITSRPVPEVTLVGHADTTQSNAYNDALSLRRAERVRAELQRLGVDPASMTLYGRGKRQPLVPTRDNVPEQRNRRVEVEVR